MFDNFPLWPARASTAAGNVDALFIFLLIVSGLMTLLIFTALVYFAARYRRRRGVLAEQIEGSTPLELTWSVIPFLVFMVIFAWGAVVYFKSRTPPRDSTEVYVVAKQWMWKLEHAEGQREINELHVPVGRDVKLIMTSQDVIHSFFVPAFRMKQDVLPGRYTVAWFRATKPGTYHLFCAEYCGTQHSGMIGSIVVMEPAQFEAWMSGGTDRPALRLRRKDLRRTRLRHLPSRRLAGPRPEPAGNFRQARAAGRRAHRNRRRKLHSRIHSRSRRESRKRIQTGHAHVSGTGERRTIERAGGLCEIVVATRRNPDEHGRRYRAR